MRFLNGPSDGHSAASPSTAASSRRPLDGRSEGRSGGPFKEGPLETVVSNGPSRRPLETTTRDCPREGPSKPSLSMATRDDHSRRPLETSRGPWLPLSPRPNPPRVGFGFCFALQPACPVCRVCAFWSTRRPAGLAVARTRARPEKTGLVARQTCDQGAAYIEKLSGRAPARPLWRSLTRPLHCHF
ncbi:hypothetical protein M885DRAFT_525105 [Pelagophyceae sp. CCMP2097]|nr:hypothetical protein M885DRAFT_525105 [Pelagophyceae sp. CCMP2097]